MASALPPSWNNALLRIGEMNDPSLKRLSLMFENNYMTYPGLNDSDDDAVTFYFSNDTPAAFFARLGDAVGNNTQLDEIEFNGLEGAVPVMAENSPFLEGLKRNSSIRTLFLSRVDFSDETICGMLHSLGERSSNLISSLTSVVTHQGVSGNDDGVRAFKALLRRCTSITELVFRQYFDDSIRFHEIVEAVGDPRKLTSIATPSIGEAGFEALVPILEDTGNVLNHLDLDISQLDVDCDRLAALLAGKTTLEELHVRLPSFIDRVVFEKSFSHALCATISGTYFSKLNVFTLFGVFVKGDVSPILEVNRRVADKKKGGMLKVMLFHPTFDIAPFLEWDLKVLPIVVERMESVRSIEYLPGEMIDNRKLIAIYQFIRALPEVFEPIVGGKRKRSGS